MDRNAMKVAAGLCVAAGAFLAAGCGGTQGAGTGASDLVPASAPVFVQIDTDPGSSQWKTVNSLAGHFPGKQKAVDAMKKDMRKSDGLDWEKDVKPALGKEVDVVWLDFGNGGTDVVGLMQPKNDGKFAKAVAKGNKEGSGSKLVYEKFNGWEVMSDSHAKIAQFEHMSNASQTSLSDDPSFQRATNKLGDAVVRAYVNGSAVMNEARSAIGPNSEDLVRKIGTLDWLAAGLGATSSGVQLNVIAHGTPGKFLKGFHAPTYRSHLAESVPEDALLYYTFHGAGGLLGGLTPKSPLYGAAPLRPFRGVLRQIAKLIQGEDAVYVRPAPKGRIPEVAVITEPAPGTNGAATLDRLLHRFRAQIGAAPQRTSIAGTNARVLNFGSFAIDYANVGNKLVVTNDPDGIWGVTLKGKLSQNPEYKDALRSAGVPSKTQGYLYVNIHSTVPLVEHLSHTQLPSEVRRNLSPLRSALEYEVARSHEVEVSLFLRIR